MASRHKRTGDTDELNQSLAIARKNAARQGMIQQLEAMQIAHKNSLDRNERLLRENSSLKREMDEMKKRFEQLEKRLSMNIRVKKEREDEKDMHDEKAVSGKPLRVRVPEGSAVREAQAQAQAQAKMEHIKGIWTGMSRPSASIPYIPILENASPQKESESSQLESGSSSQDSESSDTESRSKQRKKK